MERIARKFQSYFPDRHLLDFDWNLSGIREIKSVRREYLFGVGSKGRGIKKSQSLYFLQTHRLGKGFLSFFLSFFLSRMALHRKREASRNREQDGWNAWRGSYLKFVWYPRLDRRKKEKKEKDRGKSIRRFHSHHRVSQRGGRYSRVKNREISFFLS